MELPAIIRALIVSQNNQDSTSFAACFSRQANVYDEGRSYEGQAAIKAWNEHTSNEYKTQIEPIELIESDIETILIVNVSGRFEGSPIKLNYHLVIKDNLITSLTIKSS